MWFNKFIKRIWDEVEDFVINIIGGSIAKIVVFILGKITVFIMGKDSSSIEAINKADEIASASIFYIFLSVGLIKYLCKYALIIYYDFIDSRNKHSARVRRNNKLLENSMDPLPGRSGEIIEEKADEINEFDPSEEDWKWNYLF